MRILTRGIRENCCHTKHGASRAPMCGIPALINPLLRSLKCPSPSCSFVCDAFLPNPPALFFPSPSPNRFSRSSGARVLQTPASRHPLFRIQIAALPYHAPCPRLYFTLRHGLDRRPPFRCFHHPHPPSLPTASFHIVALLCWCTSDDTTAHAGCRAYLDASSSGPHRRAHRGHPRLPPV